VWVTFQKSSIFVGISFAQKASMTLSTRITTGDAHKLDLKIVYALLEEEEGGRSWGDFLGCRLSVS